MTFAQASARGENSADLQEVQNLLGSLMHQVESGRADVLSKHRAMLDSVDSAIAKVSACPTAVYLAITLPLPSGDF
jgi:hypothetical protein